MKIAGFEFKEGARFQSGAVLDAAAVGRHMEMLRQECKGELTPEDILQDAKNHNSPLHSFFEWDDSAAAQQYRLKQARGLISAVVAIYVQPDRPAQRIRAYVHVPEPGAPHYRETSHAMSQANTRELVLRRAWRELQQWKQRYKDLAEFAKVIEVVNEVELNLPAPVRHG